MKSVASLLILGLVLSTPSYLSAQNPDAQKPVANEKAQQADQGKEKGDQGKEKPKAGEKKDDCGGCIDKQMQAASPATKADTSKGMKLKETTPISEILAAFEKFEGKRVLVKGIALGTCAKRGCWVNLKSEKDNKSFLRVKVEDGEIVFPMTVVGKEVQVEGIVEKMVIPVETLREQGQKTAEAKGEKFDPASIKEPRIVWQLKGLGAKWDKSADKAEKTEKADKADKVDRDAGR